MGVLQSILAKIYAATQNPNAAPASSPGVVPGTVIPAGEGGLQQDVVVPQAAPVKPPSVLQTIAGVLAPEANSFMANAYQHGFMGAKQGMQEDVAAQDTAALAKRLQVAQVANAEDGDQAVGGSIVRKGDDGTYTPVYTPAPMPTEVERLIEKWKATPDGPLKQLYERAIRGYQYGDEYIARQTAAKKDIVTTGNATKRFAPRSGGGSGGGPTPAQRTKFLAEAAIARANGVPEAVIQQRLASVGVR